METYSIEPTSNGKYEIIATAEDGTRRIVTSFTGRILAQAWLNEWLRINHGTVNREKGRQ